MICPECKTSLSPTRVAEGLIWKCEACSGAAINMSVLRRYLKDDTVKKLWLEATTSSTPSKRKCPSCVNMLREFIVSRDNRQICLDLCKTCQLMWFDRDELEAFPISKKLHSPNMDENLALAKIELEAELEDEQRSAENVIGQVMDILFIVTLLFL